ncbi:MAG: energy transducer TonB [Burkholderiales bacterium]|nr:MAG: energy transducer TonB [Burkholderiales bacterium]
MDASRLSAAGGALALHGLVLTGVLMMSVAPPTPRDAEPIQVLLITPPEPLPVALAPAPQTVAQAVAQVVAQVVEIPPPAPPRASEPVASEPAPPKPVPARPPSRASAPPPPRAATPEPQPAPTTPQPAPQAATSAPSAPTAASEPARLPVDVGAPAEQAPAPASQLASARSSRTDIAAAPAGAARSAPRVDASWSGNAPPPYPGMARRMGDQGEVRLDVHVGADGRVIEVRLKQSSGSALLDRTAIDTVKKWRFKPATVDGQPVAEWYNDWRWVFRLEG